MVGCQQGANDMSKIATLKMSTGKKSQAQSPAQRQQALAPQMPVTTSAVPNALIAPKSGVFAPNTAAAAKP
jgi:hypothetical protein